ncbi:SH3 domain-containing protein [Laceyella putida]|uniref:SH3 domain-containing protein n=1 Tax=Laceyella putida TaxID=110101 RepID=A0ABW2RJF9_9BACL
MMEFLILLWLCIPTHIRLLILLVPLFLLRKVIIKYFPSLVHFVTWLVLLLLQVLAHLVYVVLGIIVVQQRKRDKTHFHGIHSIEETIEKVLVTIKGTGEKVAQTFSNRTLVTRRYHQILGGVTVVLFLSVYFAPTSAISNQWIQVDKWIVTKAFSAEYLTSEQAATQLTAMLEQMEKESAAEAGPRLKLKSEYHNGANVRESASLDARPLAEIKGDETVQYLGEEATDDDGRTWYKVETDSGVVGWISGKVVEQVQ